MFRRGWREADATVVAARNYVSTADGLAGKDSSSDLVVEVHPTDGESFRAEAKISYLGINLEQRRMTPPEVGDTIRVEYDPKHHDVKVLLDETHDRKLIEQQKKDAFRAALDAPVGSAPPVDSAVAAALQRAGLANLLDGATVTRGERGETVVQSAPQVVVQSDGEPPVTLPSHALDPTVGGAAGILANGVPCTAVVLAVIPLPGQKTSTGDDATGMVMSVTVPGFDPFQAQTGMYVPPAALALLAPGAELNGKTMPGVRDAVAIDWDAFLRASS